MTEEALDKAIAATETTESEAVEPEATKTVEPAVEKATDVTEETPDAEALVKALTSALEKADNPLRKSFEAIVEASTATTVKQLGELGERLGRVEGMAIPGGPALRRTEIERVESRKQDLEREVARYKALASNSEDATLRKGWSAKAAQFEAEIKAL